MAVFVEKGKLSEHDLHDKSEPRRENSVHAA